MRRVGRFLCYLGALWLAAIVVWTAPPIAGFAMAGMLLLLGVTSYLEDPGHLPENVND